MKVPSIHYFGAVFRAFQGIIWKNSPLRIGGKKISKICPLEAWQLCFLLNVSWPRAHSLVHDNRTSRAASISSSLVSKNSASEVRFQETKQPWITWGNVLVFFMPCICNYSGKMSAVGRVLACIIKVWCAPSSVNRFTYVMWFSNVLSDRYVPMFLYEVCLLCV